MESITKQAHAKINLSLDVVGLREDGYHLVQMVMQSLSLCDSLVISPREDEKITLSVDLPGLECDERNLVWRAAELIRKTYGITQGVDLKLSKKIPMAAGLAGGSSDCASALRGVSELFGLSVSDEELRGLGVKLGADVPYCLMGKTALAEGIGEVLSPLPPMPECGILLAKPVTSVGTAGVYKELDALSGYPHPDTQGLIGALKAGDLEGIAARLCNVLENVTAVKYPEIGQLKEQMIEEGALGSLMSGSGPTVFGIYETLQKAEAAGDAIKKRGFTGQVFATVPV